MLIIFGRESFNKIMKEFIVTNKEFISDTGWKPPRHYSEGIKRLVFGIKERLKCKKVVL